MINNYIDLPASGSDTSGSATAANQVLEIAQLTAINSNTANALTLLTSIDGKLTSPLAVTGPLTDIELRAAPLEVNQYNERVFVGTDTLTLPGVADAIEFIIPSNVNEGTIVITGVFTNAGRIQVSYDNGVSWYRSTGYNPDTGLETGSFSDSANPAAQTINLNRVNKLRIWGDDDPGFEFSGSATFEVYANASPATLVSVMGVVSLDFGQLSTLAQELTLSDFKASVEGTIKSQGDASGTGQVIMGTDGISGNAKRVRTDTSGNLQVVSQFGTGLALESGGNLAGIKSDTAQMVLSLNGIETIVNAGRANVNLISGQIAVDGNIGVVSAQTLRVTLATNVALPTGTNSIGQVTANAGSNLNTSLLSLETTQLAMSAKLPATLGQKAMTASMAVVLASDQTSIPVAATLAAETTKVIGTVNIIGGQTSITAGAGSVAANTPRMTHASDDPVVTALQIIDDWDETDRAKVNLIAGQVGVTGGTGVDSANTLRTSLATNVALPAGTNVLGKVRPVDSSDADLTTTVGTQTTRAMATQNQVDAGRTHINFYAIAAAAGTTTTETAITLTKSSGTSATATGVSFAITNGKRYRITSFSVATRGNATATIQTTTFNFRINTGGGVVTSSTPIVLSARSATGAVASAWDRFYIPIPDGFEILGTATLQIGITAAATYTTNAPTWDVLITGFEY